MRRLLLFIASCTAAVALQAQSYQLVWADEFSGSTLDTDIWNIETGNGSEGWGNWELEYYTKEAISLGKEPTTQANCLIITAQKEERGGYHFTSGRMHTRSKVYFTHGKVEARIMLPQTANGLWPAFWMMGNDISQVGWPRCGEIDILEMGNANGIKNGTQDRYFNGACHWGFYNEQSQYPNYARSSTWDYSLQDGRFHTFTLIWNLNQIAMYVDMDTYPDREPYYVMNINDYNGDWAVGNYFHKPNFILFNLAVGGLFTGITKAENITALNNGPRAMYVDYVRVYQQGTADESFVGQSPNYDSTGIESFAADKTVERTEYLDLQGRIIDPAHAPQGVLIRRTTYTDGTYTTTKILK